MSESPTEEVDVEEIKSSDEYQSLKERVEDLEDQIQDQIEELQRNGREQEMYDQFNQESNFGY